MMYWADFKVVDLRKIAKEHEIVRRSKMNKKELINVLKKKTTLKTQSSFKDLKSDEWDNTVWFPIPKFAAEDEVKELMEISLKSAALLLHMANGKTFNKLSWKILNPYLINLFPSKSYVDAHVKYIKSNPMLYRSLIAYERVDSSPILFSVRKIQPKPGANIYTDDIKHWWYLVKGAIEEKISEKKENDKFYKFNLKYIHNIIQNGILKQPKNLYNNKPITLFRCQQDMLPWTSKDIKVNNVLTNESIWSTSLTIAYGYLNKQKNNWCCLYKINVPPNCNRILYISHELIEILIAANTKLKISEINDETINVPYSNEKVNIRVIVFDLIM
jgi:hypothetical protein